MPVSPISQMSLLRFLPVWILIFTKALGTNSIDVDHARFSTDPTSFSCGVSFYPSVRLFTGFSVPLPSLGTFRALNPQFPVLIALFIPSIAIGAQSWN